MAEVTRARVIVSESDGTRRTASWLLHALLRLHGVSTTTVRHDDAYPDAGSYDGLVIAGGEDVEPALYDGVSSSARSTNAARDSRELRLLDDAARHATPVLAICRGAQILNVHRGGTLYGDLSWIAPGLRERRRVLDTRRALVHAGSRLRRALDSIVVGTNSFHHQAVAGLGRGLRVVAQDLDGITLAVECTESDTFVMGVQWHPELLPWRPKQRRLFAAFADAVERARLCKRLRHTLVAA